MKSILFVLFFVLSVAAFFACYAEASQRIAIRNPPFRPNVTIARRVNDGRLSNAELRAIAALQAQQHHQPQAFFFVPPQVQAFSFGPHVQQFSAPGNCPSALLFGR